MATQYIALNPLRAVPDLTNPPAIVSVGATYPVWGLAFDSGTTEIAFFYFRAINFDGSSDWTLDIDWFAVTSVATGDEVVWDASMWAFTPNTDSGVGIDGKSFSPATPDTVTDTILGTTAKRLHRATITIANADLDGAAQDDFCCLKLERDADEAADDLGEDAIIPVGGLTLSYTSV